MTVSPHSEIRSLRKTLQARDEQLHLLAGQALKVYLENFNWKQYEAKRRRMVAFFENGMRK